MRDMLRKFLNLEIYTDTITRRRAQNLYIVAIILLLIHVFFSLEQILGEEVVWDEFGDIGAFMLVLAISFYLNRSGQSRSASAVLVFGGILVALLPSLLLAEERELTLSKSYSLWLALATPGLVVTRRDTVIFTITALIALTIGFMVGVETPDSIHLGSEISQISYLTFTGIIGVVSWTIARSLELGIAAEQVQETRRRLTLTQTSHAVTQRIFSRLDLETLLTETVEQIRSQFEDIYHAQVFLIDEDSKMAVLRASTGDVGRALLARKHALPVGSVSVIGRVTEVGIPVLASDTSTDVVHRTNELLPDTLTELAIPLRSQDGIIGALDVQSRRRNAFSPEDIEILQLLADQIAVAVENARLFAAAQDETERAKAIAEASQITSRLSTNFERGLASLFEAITAPGSYTHWWFGLVEPDRRYIRRVTSHRAVVTMYLVPSVIDTLNDHNSLAYVYQNKNGIIVNDLRNSPSFVGGGSPELREMFGKHIAAPIFAADGETVVGVLLVGREKDGEDMSERDLELVQTVIAQIGIALQNRKLLSQLQEEQQTLQSILDNMPVSVVVVNNRNRILLANSQAQSLLGDNIRAGQTFEIRHPLYRTGTNTPYPLTELPIHMVQQQGEYYSAEDLAIGLPTGEQIDLVSRAAPIRDENGNITSVVAVFQDISELRELEQALQESLSETTKLYEVSRSVSHATTVESISRTVTQQLSSLQPKRIYITLADSNENIRLAYTWPLQDAPATIEDIQLPKAILMPSARMGTTNLTFATRNLHLLPGMGDQELSLLTQQGINGLAVLPLEARGEVFGAIVATFSQERQFSPEERRFLLTLADQTSIAMDAVLSFSNTQQALQTTSNLYQASRAIAEVQDINEAMLVIRDQLQRLQPDRITITISRDQEFPEQMEAALDWALEGEAPPPFLILPSGKPLFDTFSRDDYYVEDVLSDDNPLAARLGKQAFPYQAIASVPFRAAGQSSGRLTLGFNKRHIFSEDEQQFIRMIADSTAYVIENDMLFRQTQDSLEETGILYQAIRAFANSKDTHGILQAIIDYAADPAVDKALLCQLLTDSWSHPNALMEVVVSWVRSDSVDLTGMRFTAEQFPSWEQISTSEILWVDDVMQDPTLDDTARMGYRALDIASFLIVPLVMAGKPIGAILLGSSEPRRHTEREIRVYQSLADQAAITIESLRLYDEAERRARQLATAAQVGQAASSILQIDELLPQMVDLIKNSFGYDQVQVFLISEDGKNAVLKASTGEAGRQLLAIGHFLPVGSYSVIGTVTSTGKPSIALDTADARVVHKPNPYLPNTRSEMAIPLVAKGKVLGALDVQSNQPGAFTDADLRVLSILADQMAVAIENASLFELSQQRSEEMGFLFTVAAEATTANQFDMMLQRISELLLHQLNATIVIPYLFNESQQALKLGAIATVYPVESLQLIEEVSLDSDEDPVATVAIQKMPIVIPDMRQNGHHPVRSANSKSGVYVPLLAGTTFIGVLVLESDQPDQFDDNALNLLQALTSSLSAVIHSNRLLKDIQEANERLREIDKLKTNFLAAMSHELRTPLNSIIGFSRVILKGIDGPVTEMQQQDLQTIHDSGKHLLGLVNDILDQAKIEAGKMELSREYFDLSEVVKGVMSSAIGLTKEKPIRLYTEIQPDLPQAFGDEFRTRQILFNLVSNAAKFTDEGSITTSTRIIEVDGRHFIQVSVTDTGIGIRQEDFPKLFESFQQVDNSTTRAAEGTGLGLPLAKSLAELQGGQIWVESEYGVGSTFSFTIPIEPVETPETEPSEAASDGRDGSSSKPIPRTVLVVEDNMDMINFYRRHLSKKGYDVVGVPGLDDAIEKIVSIRPTAVIINVNMDNNQGWNYLENLLHLELPQPIPVIVSCLQDETTRSHEMGAAFHLTRPFTPDDLLNAIQQLENRVSS